jgi:hypothetical protein
VGNYYDPLFGSVAVTADGGQLSLQNNDLQMTLEHWHFDTFRGQYQNRWAGKEWVQFKMDTDGKIAEVWVEHRKFKKEKK